MLINEIFISGLILGGLYALLSLGFALINGVARIFNLAHGTLYMLCAYYMSYLFPIMGLEFSIVLSLILTVITGMLMYQFFIHPLRKKNFPAVIVTLSLAIFFQALVSLPFIGGSNYRIIPEVVTGYSWVLGVRVVNQKIVVIIAAFILVAFLALFINRTRVGKSIKAVAQNLDVARLVGINVRNTFMITMGISALLAGFAAILFAPLYYGAYPSMWTILFQTFPVLILGGLGSLKGALVGAFVISYTETIVSYTTSGGQLVQIVTFALMLLIIFFRPTGIFGKKVISMRS